MGTLMKTEFTIEQLEKLRELALKDCSVNPTPDAQNLSRKLVEYVSQARTAPRLKLAS
jgi:hypothetical protein